MVDIIWILRIDRDIYVTVNLYNQVICILPDVFS